MVIADFDFWIYLRVRGSLFFGLLFLVVGYRIRTRDNKNSLLVSSLILFVILLVGGVVFSSATRMLKYVFVYEEAKELLHVNYIFSLGTKRLKEQKTRYMSMHTRAYPEKTQ